MQTFGTPLLWIVFGVVVVVVLAIDLAMAAKKPPDVEKGVAKRKALAWVVAWVAVGCAFGAWVLLKDRETGLQWFSTYVIEYSLSVDNLFVFLLLFHAFRVPRGYQHRVLFYGILGAVLLRGVFILGGTALLSEVHAFIAVFGAFLVYSGGKLVFGGDDDDGDVADNRVVKIAKRFVRVTDSYDRDRFFTIVEGVKKATPLLLVAVCVEISDVLFAFDSVPAAFGISLDPFVVYTSNIFAILGLRSIFFLLSGALWGLRFLKPALGIVLAFIGFKMCLGAAHWLLDKVAVDATWLPEKIPTPVSLGVVAFFLAGGVALSLLFPGKKENQVAAAEEIKEDVREIVHGKD